MDVVIHAMRKHGGQYWRMPRGRFTDPTAKPYIVDRGPERYEEISERVNGVQDVSFWDRPDGVVEFTYWVTAELGTDAETPWHVEYVNHVEYLNVEESAA